MQRLIDKFIDMMHHNVENIPNCLNIKQTLIKQIAQFMYQYDNNKLPKAFTDFFFDMQLYQNAVKKEVPTYI